MSLLPPRWSESVVAIGTKNAEEDFVADSTGFLVKIDSDQRLFLVTNRHVFDGKSDVVLKFNDKLAPLLLKDSEGAMWTKHKNKNVDIAVSFIPVSTKQTVLHESLFGTTDLMKKEGMREGDEVFILGFPRGIVGIEANFPIVRNGMIARFDDEILKNYHYYIDAPIYGGNSGGPVILKSVPFRSGNTNSPKTAYVIGVVASVELQRSTLYGIKNGIPEARMTLYENIHLGRVIPMEYVMETIELLRKSRVKLLGEGK